MVKFKVVRLCRHDAMSIAPMEVLRYDLDKVAQILSEKGYEITNQGPMVIAKKGDIDVTVYTNGRMMVANVNAKERAGEIATSIYEAVEGAREGLSPRRS